MSVDLSQFHQVFFEESFEGLDSMESALMELDPDAIDAETINCIFRAAHSIKGGSATFGFNVVSEFTHVLETLLDEVRSGTRSISADDVDLLLQSVDCLRDLLGSIQSESDIDTSRSDELKQEFEKILAGDSAGDSAADVSSVGDSSAPAKVVTTKENTPEVTPVSHNGWRIEFKPSADILATGNEPLRMFRELATLGEVSVSCSINALPALTNMDPESCSLSWVLDVISNEEKAQLEEVFEWVSDESDIIISPFNADEAVEKPTASDMSGWFIHFQPNKDMLRTGNEPSRLFRELAELGDMAVSVHTSKLVSFAALEPECCYLSWDISLVGEIEKSAVEHIFEWVMDEAVVDIAPLSQQQTIEKTQSTAPIANISVAKEEQSQSVDQTNPPATVASNDPAPVAAKTNAPAKVRAPTKAGESSSIRVAIDKVDNLINMVGELVITQSMLGQIGNNFSEDQLSRLREGLSQLEHNTRELQESVMRIRMLPISFAFSRFPRMVRDLSRRLGKQIELELLGEQTELDKTVMERIGDPLVHLVRNAVDHGIETPEERATAGKTAGGKITLNAYHQSGNVVIEIIDDGRGLSRQKLIEKALRQQLISQAEANSMSDIQVYDLIFHPGFSTAQTVSDVSGRGVGMDVVKRNIQELNGSVDIKSEENVGTTITIRLPLTLAILDGQLVRVGNNTYIFPLVSIVESMQIDDASVNLVAGGCEVFQLRDEYVPIVKLYEVFNINPDSTHLRDSLLVVVESDGNKVGLVVDELEAQQQVVIKSLEQNYHRIEGVSGATILGDGTVSLILDIPGIVKIAGVKHRMNNSMYGSHQQSEHAINIH
ncbi:chemotaxis protein CheA [Aurantivibrio plasticivorans]